MTTASQREHVAYSPTAEAARKQSVSWHWIIWLAIPVSAILAFAIFQPIIVLPRMGLGPGFGLIDSNGQRLTNEDLRGHIVLYNFTYTACTAPCPQTTARMAEVNARVGQMNLRNIPFSLVTISFDPERDTPAALKTFAQHYTGSAADSSAQNSQVAAPWYFVTGDALPLKYVIGGGFSTYYQANDDGTFVFDPTLVLVDGAGIIRAKYRTTTPDLAIIQRDIELVAKEAEESTGPTRLAYEAAHLFLCYPK